MRRIVENLAFTLWIGGGAFLMAVAAPAAFRHAPDRTAAADIVGAMLGRWHFLALAAPLLLLILLWRRSQRRLPLVLVALAVLLAASQITADLRIREIRRNSPVAISTLAPDHPVRRQFGALHGISSLLMLSQVLLGAGALVTRSGSHD
jgi:MFS superfamily sulfate permease-like transporter